MNRYAVATSTEHFASLSDLCVNRTKEQIKHFLHWQKCGFPLFGILWGLLLPTFAHSSQDELHVSRSAKVLIRVNGDDAIRESLPTTMFGFNINWFSFQDQLWNSDLRQPKPEIAEYLMPFQGALYRYPGGQVANGFDWSRTIGSVDQRKPQKSVYGDRTANTLFGINEYLNFVTQVNGRSLYVLNLVGLDPMHPMTESDEKTVAKHNQELAKYLLTQKQSSSSPYYYQLGNELDRWKYEWSHQKYIDRSLATITAIREVDKNARFMAFLRDFEWRYKRKAPKAISSPSDFVSDVMGRLPMMEDYSLQHYYDGKRAHGDSHDLSFILERIIKSIKAYKAVRNGRSPRIWITEHARQKSSHKPGNDHTREYASNLGGTVSTIDYLIGIAQIPEIQGACWHGLNAGIWQLFDYSIKHRDLRPRPIYWGLRVLREMQLPVVLATQTLSTNNSDYKGGYDVRAVGFRDESRQGLGVWVVNRATQSVQAELEYPQFKGQRVSVWQYYLAGKPGIDPDDPQLEPTWELEPKVTVQQFSSLGKLILILPPASVSTFMFRKQSEPQPVANIGKTI